MKIERTKEVILPRLLMEAPGEAKFNYRNGHKQAQRTGVCTEQEWRMWEFSLENSGGAIPDRDHTVINAWSPVITLPLVNFNPRLNLGPVTLLKCTFT